MTAAFPPTARLRSPREFEAVLSGGRRLNDPLLTAAVRSNAMNHARLGLAISARAVPTAVARNRIKRTIRESFRRARAALPAVDIVMLARSAAKDARRPALDAALARLWQRVQAG